MPKLSETSIAQYPAIKATELAEGKYRFDIIKSAIQPTELPKQGTVEMLFFTISMNGNLRSLMLDPKGNNRLGIHQILLETGEPVTDCVMVSIPTSNGMQPFNMIVPADELNSIEFVPEESETPF